MSPSPPSTSHARRAVRRAVRALPSPRDESAVAVLRSLRAFIRGTAAPVAHTPPKAVRAGRQPTTGLAGRWVRVTQAETPTDPPLDREPADPAEAAAVRAGWLLIDAYERLSIHSAKRIFGHEIKAWDDYTDDTILKLKSPDGRIMVDIEESKTNRLRYRRTMDFAHEGDRVFDVGFGRGYLAAQLIGGRGVARYHGIDIVDTWVEEAHRLVEANGLASADIVLEAGDLFALTPEKIGATDANLVICCEVLEHVDDAELALRILADALPPGADLLFSVPLHGRLEHVWGHASVFDVARLKQMLDGAGLYAHHVEPLANTWSLIVASRDPAPSARVRDASARPAVRASVPLVRERRFVDLRADQISSAGGGAGQAVVAPISETAVTCHLTATGGLSFPVRGLESLRLAFDFIDCEGATRFDVIARVGSKKVMSWSWTPDAELRAKGTRRVWFRPGEASTGFVAGPYGRMLEVDSVEVIARVPAGHTAIFGMAAAFLP